MNVANEVLQWCMIISAMLLTLACYRHVAAVEMGSRRYITESFGPSVGAPAPERMAWFFAKDDPTDERPRVLLFVSEQCKICAELIRRIAESEPRISPHNRALPWQVGFVVDGGLDFVKRVRNQLPDAVVDTLPRIMGGRYAPKGYPFMVEFDSRLVTTRKILGGDILEQLFSPRGSSEGGLSEGSLSVDGRNEV